MYRGLFYFESLEKTKAARMRHPGGQESPNNQ
jgi:hypothetical protein